MEVTVLVIVKLIIFLAFIFLSILTVLRTVSEVKVGFQKSFSVEVDISYLYIFN